MSAPHNCHIRHGSAVPAPLLCKGKRMCMSWLPAPAGTQDAGPNQEVWPVFRTSPYRAEAARRAQGGSTTRILFVDEGQGCRHATLPCALQQ